MCEFVCVGAESHIIVINGKMHKHSTHITYNVHTPKNTHYTLGLTVCDYTEQSIPCPCPYQFQFSRLDHQCVRIYVVCSIRFWYAAHTKNTSNDECFCDFLYFSIFLLCNSCFGIFFFLSFSIFIFQLAPSFFFSLIFFYSLSYAYDVCMWIFIISLLRAHKSSDHIFMLISFFLIHAWIRDALPAKLKVRLMMMLNVWHENTHLKILFD